MRLLYRAGQIVEIIRIDPGEDPAWRGLRCLVADTYIQDIATATELMQSKSIKLVPLSDRPDAKYPEIGKRAEFFWPEDDVQLSKHQKLFDGEGLDDDFSDL